MRRPAALALTSSLVISLIAACGSDDSSPDPSPTSTVRTTESPDVTEHESGPESPIGFGLQVPQGATQLGPLARFRSQRLIDAYTPELEAAVAKREAEARDKADEAEREDEADGVDEPATPSPTPTPDPRPSDDSFTLLEERPRPDTVISLMRIDGNPSLVVRRMLAQVAAALPKSDVTTDDLSRYCDAEERRITSCRLSVQGLTAEGREVRITVTVDPGDLRTRTSPPSSQTRPVMTLTVEYVGEPRRGQVKRESSEIGDVERVTADGDASGLIWPKMDEDAPATTELAGGWTAPSSARLLLTGFRPGFVAMTTKRAAEGDIIAETFATSHQGKGGTLVKDVVEDLNEVSTTYTATAKDGSVARGIYVLSARGNYTMLFFQPGDD